MGKTAETISSAEVLAINLRRLRETNGLTQAQVADAVGLHVNTVAKIERGQTTSIDTLDAFAAAMGVQSWQLIKPRQRKV